MPRFLRGSTERRRLADFFVAPGMQVFPGLPKEEKHDFGTVNYSLTKTSRSAFRGATGKPCHGAAREERLFFSSDGRRQAKFAWISDNSLCCSRPRAPNSPSSVRVSCRVFECVSRDSARRVTRNLFDTSSAAPVFRLRVRVHNSISSGMATTGLHKLCDIRRTGRPSCSHRCAVRTVRRR